MRSNEESYRFAEVYVDIPAEAAPKPFDYSVPDSLATDAVPGSLVLVPFGRSQRLGVIGSLKATPSVQRTLPIAEVAMPRLVSEEMMRLCAFVAGRYLASFFSVFRAALPPGGIPRLDRRWLVVDGPALEEHLRARGIPAPNLASLDAAQMEMLSLTADAHSLIAAGVLEREFRLRPPRVKEKVARHLELAVPAEEALAGLRKGAVGQRRVVELLDCSGEPLPLTALSEAASASAVKALQEKGLIRAVTLAVARRPMTYSSDKKEHDAVNAEQTSAIDRISTALEAGSYARFLIQGVTASGKSKVYLECVQKAVDAGKGAIVIVPEISLTPQMLGRFEDRFGERVSIFHSGLGSGERFDEWSRVNDGCPIVIGTRSAIFAPVRDLGIIVIDEEHDGSYKQDTEPRYHLPPVAAERARLNGAVLVTGSATPLIESRYAADSGECGLIRLNRRAGGRPEPEIRVVDMRGRPAEEATFSHELLQAVGETLDGGDKALIYLNRRGFARFLLCRECGWVARCPACDVGLVYHKADSCLRCHSCGHQEEEAAFCPVCAGATRIFGLGIQRVEEELHRRYPDATVYRVDSDSTRRKGAHARLLGDFERDRRKAILLGTQMVTKGLDYPDIGFVGVLNADASLNLPDFRASERTFQHLVQVAGRTGRGTKPGLVILQSFEPEHDAVTATGGTYDEFYAAELEHRRQLSYPPFSEIINVILSGPDEEAVCGAADRMADACRAALDAAGEVLGPAPAPFQKIKSDYRWHLLIKAGDGDEARRAVGMVAQDMRRRLGRKARITIDVDPFSMM